MKKMKTKRNAQPNAFVIFFRIEFMKLNRIKSL